MIKTEKLTPSIYYKDSRDFQVFGRVLDAVSNYFKANTRFLYNTEDSRMMLLLAKTLGFEAKHEYLLPDLRELLSAFCYITKRKGSLDAVKYCAELLMSAQHLSGDVLVLRDPKDPYLIIVNFPSEEVVDLVMFEDLMDYVLPAGVRFDYTYSIGAEAKTEIVNSSKVRIRSLSQAKFNLGRMTIIDSQSVEEISLDSGSTVDVQASDTGDTEALSGNGIPTGQAQVNLVAPRDSDDPQEPVE